MAPRQNHTNAGISSARKMTEKVKTVLYPNRDYKNERWEKLEE